MIDLLGYGAGILVVVSLLPQVIKSWKTKEIRDTNGLKEFQINKEDGGKWENEDAEPTKEFKESLHKWKSSLK